MKRKKGAFDIEDIFAYLAFVAMVIFFVIILMIRSSFGLPFLGKNPDKQSLTSNDLAIIEVDEGMVFLNFMKQTVDLNGEEMPLSELLTKYYYGDKFMDVPDDVKKAQKEKILEKFNEAYSKRCIFVSMKNKGEEKEIRFQNEADGCGKCFDFAFKYGIPDEASIVYIAVLPSQYEQGLSWLTLSVIDISFMCKK